MEKIERDRIGLDRTSIVYTQVQNGCCFNKPIKVLDKDLMLHKLYEIILKQQTQIENLQRTLENTQKRNVSIGEFKDLQKELYKLKYKNLFDILQCSEQYKIWNTKNIYRFIWKDYLNEHFNSKFPHVKIHCGDEYIYVEIKRNTYADSYSITAIDKPLIQIVEEIKSCIDKNIME